MCAVILNLCDLLSIFKFLMFHFITNLYLSKTVDRLSRAYFCKYFLPENIISYIIIINPGNRSAIFLSPGIVIARDCYFVYLVISLLQRLPGVNSLNRYEVRTN